SLRDWQCPPRSYSRDVHHSRRLWRWWPGAISELSHSTSRRTRIARFQISSLITCSPACPLLPPARDQPLASLAARRVGRSFWIEMWQTWSGVSVCSKIHRDAGTKGFGVRLLSMNGTTGAATLGSSSKPWRKSGPAASRRRRVGHLGRTTVLDHASPGEAKLYPDR